MCPEEGGGGARRIIFYTHLIAALTDLVHGQHGGKADDG